MCLLIGCCKISPVFSWVRVALSLVLCVVFCRSLFVLFLLAIVLSVLLSFGHCVVCSSVFWPLCCLSFCLLAIVLSVLLSFGHCVDCTSSILIPLWYLQVLLDMLVSLFNWTTGMNKIQIKKKTER